MLTDSEKALLEVVLGHAGDMEKMVPSGIIKALRDVNDNARRIYLWGILSRAAKEEIRRARQKVALRQKVAV